MSMTYRPLGHSGLRVSSISLGSWLTYGAATDDAQALACLDKAFELGINFFDTADVYNRGGAETLIGKWLQQVPRQHVVLATKAFFPMSDHWMDKGLSARHLNNAVTSSLERLQTEYLDLYQCHRYDYDTPLDETCHAMHLLVESGVVLHWGVSQWTTAQILNAIRTCERNGWRKPISNQPIYNLLNRSLEIDVMDTCEQEGLGLVTYSPLAQGILSGKYKAGEQPAPDTRAGNPASNTMFAWKRLNEDTFRVLEGLRPIAQELGVTLSQLAIAWCLRKSPVSSVITGASRPEQVTENVHAATLHLAPDVLERLEAVLQNAPRDQYTGNPVGHGVPRTV
jgi:aryl-alcohol dehydrogenase-like predicted oxidoreductase